MPAGVPFKQTLTTLRRELLIPLGNARPKISVRLLTSGNSVWELVVDVPASLVTCGDITFAMPPQIKPEDAIRIFIDGSVIESFIAGRECLTSRVYNLAPDKTDLELTLQSAGGLEVMQWPLQTISPDRLTT